MTGRRPAQVDVGRARVREAPGRPVRREPGGPVIRGESRTATFTLPEEISDLVRGGAELGTATDQVMGDTDTKSTTGTVGPLTGGVIDRVAFYAHALVLAMVPFRNVDLTFRAAEEPVLGVHAK